MKLSNLQSSFPGSFQYIGPLFRVDEPVPLTLQVVERGPCTSCSITQNIGLFQQTLPNNNMTQEHKVG